MSKDVPSPDVAGLIEVLQQYNAAVTSCLMEGGVIGTRKHPAKWWGLLIAAQQKGGHFLSRLTPPKQDECCVPDEDEPQFVLLGRDPQAPALVDEWARVRRLAEPESPKPAMAGIIAARMRAYKLTHPEKGMAASALPKQDDARDSTVGAEVVAWMRTGGAINLPGPALMGRENPNSRGLGGLWEPLYTAASLASARADGIREASKAANEVHEYYAGVRDRTPTGTPAHYVMQECVIASARTWRAVAALLPDQPAAIRALINKDAGEV